MKQPSVYLKMRVLGAVDTVAGRTRDQRMHAVAAMTFLDEEGNPRRFTWRTIQTWFYRYKNLTVPDFGAGSKRRQASRGHRERKGQESPCCNPHDAEVTLGPTLFYHLPAH